MAYALVVLIDLLAIVGLLTLSQRKTGLEAALPFAAFLITLVPVESALPFGFFTLTTHRVVLVVLVILYIARGAGNKKPGNNTTLPLLGLIVMHATWCVIATANSIVPMMSLKKMLSIVGEYYGLYFIFWKAISSEESLLAILKAIAFALILCSVFGAFESYTNWTVLSYFPSESHHWEDLSDSDRATRIQSTYGHAILYGAALATGITLTLYLLTVVQSQWEKTLLFIGLLLMFLNIYKTSSRGPWIDVILGCGLLLIFSRNKVRRLTLYLASLALLVCLIRPGVWGTISGIYINTFSAGTATGSSYSYRYALQDAAITRLMQFPTTRALWGFGPESFFDVHLTGMLLGKPHTFLSCDNAWVELMVESGFVGLLIMVVLLTRPLLAALKQYLRLKAAGKQIALLLLVNFLMYYVQMYSVGMYGWGQNCYVLWILVALTFVNPVVHARNSQTTRPKAQLSNERKWWVPRRPAELTTA